MKMTTAVRNSQADNHTPNYNTGYQRIYNGTKPTDANTALSGNTLLAELRYSATAFGAAVAGVATANAITQDSSADATGTATFARNFKSDGTTVISDFTVGTSGADLNLVTLSIVITQPVQVTSCTITQPDGT